MKKLYIAIAFMFLLTSCWEVEQAQESTTQNAQPALVNNIEEAQDEQQTLLVTSSIVPISSVVRTIGWQYVEVENIIPAGVSPHGFDMSAQQRAKIEDAEIVFFTGLDHIDGFLGKSVPDEVQVHLADDMKLIEVEGHDDHDDHGDEEAHDEHEEDDHSDDEHHDDHKEEHHDDHKDEAYDDDHEDHDDHEGEEHDDHSSDPHVWLGKDNIITIAKKVEAELTEKLPEQAEYFTTNRQNFENDLNAIYADFAAKTAGKTAQEFIIFHDAYNYLFESMGLDRNLKVPFSQNVLHDTGTAHLAELIDEIKIHGITHVFREPQFSDSNLNTLANEYNLSVGTLDPLGTDDSAEGYLNNIKSNLDALTAIYE